MRTTLSIAIVALLCSLTGCGHHIRLETPESSPGARFVCTSRGCEPAKVDEPQLEAEAGTRFIVLPRECGGRFAQVLVRDAGSAEPTVHVACAVPEAPMGTMDATPTPP